MAGSWELGGPEAGGAHPGWPTPLCLEPISCLQMSQHIFVMSPIKFSSVFVPLGILSGQKDWGTVCPAGARHLSAFRRPQEGFPQVSMHLARVHREAPR